MPFEVHGEPANYNWQSADDAHGVQNQAGEPDTVLTTTVMDDQQNEIARHGEAEPCQDETEPVAQFVRQVGDCH